MCSSLKLIDTRIYLESSKRREFIVMRYTAIYAGKFKEEEKRIVYFETNVNAHENKYFFGNNIAERHNLVSEIYNICCLT